VSASWTIFAPEIPKGEARALCLRDDEGRYCVDVHALDGEDNESMWQRARLLAAAADLLAACRDAISATGGSQHWNGETEAFLQKMERAIDKAEGRS
jgi:hypothetical protein